MSGLGLAAARRATGAIDAPDLALWCCMALVPLVQLVPLPPQIWTLLPNRELAAATFDLLGREAPWLPLSISPRATWLAVLSLLPPCAVFLSIVALGYRQRRQSLIVLAVGARGSRRLLQLSQGPKARCASSTRTPAKWSAFCQQEPLRRASLFPAAGLCGLGHPRRGTGWVDWGLGTSRPASVMAVMASFTLIVTLIAAQAMARSRAGLGLTIIALLGVLAIAVVQRRRRNGITPARLPPRRRPCFSRRSSRSTASSIDRRPVDPG